MKIPKKYDHNDLDELHLTYHAVRRYIERINPNATIDEAIKELINNKLITQIKFIKNGIIPTSKCTVIVTNYKIVTILKSRLNKYNKKAMIRRLRVA